MRFPKFLERSKHACGRVLVREGGWVWVDVDAVFQCMKSEPGVREWVFTVPVAVDGKH